MTQLSNSAAPRSIASTLGGTPQPGRPEGTSIDLRVDDEKAGELVEALRPRLSTVTSGEELPRLVREALDEPVTVIGRDIPLPMETLLAEPDRIGADRLCTAAAAFQRIQQPCVVADFGTAVTIDCVNDQGLFLGGAILPGMKMQASALGLIGLASASRK